MQQNNARIAKNTAILYARMLLTVGINLYTSRLVLDTLGVDDYGIYNVVGGVVTMFAFLNSSMAGATQRFLTFELGKKDTEKLKRVFATSVSIHFVIALLILALAETVGLWFLNAKINIAPDRMIAANWVYQCSVFSFLLNIICVPYSACVVAHEKMSAFAGFQIIETLLCLGIVYLVMLGGIDKLILYALLMLVVALLNRAICTHYCKRHFEECIYRFVFDKPLFREMFAFAGWHFYAGTASVVSAQGITILLNVFFGVTVNAAQGVAGQIRAKMQNFISSFQTALNPQITKYYAEGNLDEMRKLVWRSCRFSFYLISMIVIPVYINVDDILSIWLKEVPAYSNIFLQLILLDLAIGTITNPIITAYHAIGEIKNYSLFVGSITLLTLPLSYWLLKLNEPPYSVFYVTLGISIVGLFVRFYLLQRRIKLFRWWYFVICILLRNILLFGMMLAVSFYVKSLLAENLLSLITTTAISVLLSGTTFYYLGLEKQEKEMVRKSLRKVIWKN
ncbi:MAG: lipopolysaccharide biosynthesis protein [Dysgonamonadaceae bacterium]|jgi:O-antigen/teichoic acid export membrane protein|nr:lipopolysaccharide biosynthesis protein [Dysgonamonadaceae bacterium]